MDAFTVLAVVVSWVIVFFFGVLFHEEGQEAYDYAYQQVAQYTVSSDSETEPLPSIKVGGTLTSGATNSVSQGVD